MTLFLIILIASLVGSVVAMLGGMLLLINEALAKRLSIYLLSFAAGSLMAAAIFELLPESLAGNASQQTIFISFIAGIILFYILEKLLNFYHCHDQEKC